MSKTTDKSTDVLPSPEPNGDVSTQLRGEGISFALQQGIYNTVGNLFEPIINARIQKHLSGKESTYTQNLAGEFIGDFLGTSTLIMAESVAPEPLHKFTKAARAYIDPVADKIARRFIKQDDMSSEAYEQKIERWKTFQERNFVRSAIMAVTGVTGNVLAQKYIMHNPAPLQHIFAGKMVGTTITTSMHLGARLAYPKEMNKLDKWVSEKVFVPMMGEGGKHQSASDQQTQPFTDRVSKRAKDQSLSHTDRVTQQRDENNLQPTLQ